MLYIPVLRVRGHIEDGSLLQANRQLDILRLCPREGHGAARILPLEEPHLGYIIRVPHLLGKKPLVAKVFHRLEKLFRSLDIAGREFIMGTLAG